MLVFFGGAVVGALMTLAALWVAVAIKVRPSSESGSPPDDLAPTLDWDEDWTGMKR